MKLRWELLPLGAVQEVIKALMFGADKWSDHSPTWREGNAHDHFPSIMRHVVAWQEGETHDPESGLHHLAHAASRMLMVLTLEKK